VPGPSSFRAVVGSMHRALRSVAARVSVRRTAGRHGGMRRPVSPVVVLACLMCAAPAAAQDGAARLATDCQDDRIDGTYTQKEFRDGLRALPSDVDEYSACRQTIRSAQLRAAAAAGAGAQAPGGVAATRAAGAGDGGAGAVAGARSTSASGRGGGGGPGSAPADPGPTPGPGSSAPAATARSEAAAPASVAPAPAAPPASAADGAGEGSAVGAAITGAGRAATPAVTPPATARVLGVLGLLVLAGLGAALWTARHAGT